MDGCSLEQLVVLVVLSDVVGEVVDFRCPGGTCRTETSKNGELVPPYLESSLVWCLCIGVDTVINGTNTRSMPTIASATAAPCSDLLDNLTDDVGKSITEELCDLDDSTFHEVFTNLQYVLGDNSSFLPKIKALQAKHCDCCNRNRRRVQPREDEL